jgi:ribonuclease BN (tRNA processing enzyme)
MPKLQIIGAASGMPEAHVSNSSYLLRFKNKSYLFDCGEGASSAMLRLGVKYKKITTVFISHGHPDHIAGLPVFIQMNHLAQRMSPLDIYLPDELAEPTDKFLHATYLIPERLTFDWRLIPMKPNPVFRNDNIAVNIFPNQHLMSYDESIARNRLPNKMQSYCFSVVTSSPGMRKRTKMVYSGDLMSAEDLNGVINGADLLLTEALHLDMEELFVRAAQSGIKQVVLTHLPSDYRTKRGIIKKTAIKAGLSNVAFADEGEVYNY